MSQCRICDSTNLTSCIDLGEQPWCNNFLEEKDIGSEPIYPLRVVFCNDCKTAQLDYTVKKEIMFGDHTYLSGITKSLSNHFKSIAKETVSKFFSNKDTKKLSVLDIGSNDGTQLVHYKNLGCDVLGVESSKTTARIAQDNGINTINEFFNLETAEKLDQDFDIINASGVFFHLEELHSVCKGIKLVLKEEGIFTVQFLYMKSIVDNCAFDQIYHEHLLYYTLETIQVLLKKHGLELFDAYLAPIHGGSIIGYVSNPGIRPKTERLIELEREEECSQINTLKTYQDFNERIKVLKEKDLEYLENAKKNGKVVYGFGAPVKGNTLLNFFGINKTKIEYLVEKNHLRKDLYSPGSHIPIVLESEIDRPPDIYYVLAWNFKNEILKNNQGLIERGVEFYFPINPK